MIKMRYALAAAIGAAVLFAAPVGAEASVNAGMSAIISDCLNRSEGLASKSGDDSVTRSAAHAAKLAAVALARNTEQPAQIADAAETQESPSDDESEQADTAPIGPEAEDGTFCGYTNFGFANVGDYLNIREEPDESAELVGKMPAGAGCEVYDGQDGWYHVKSGKVEGYVSADYLLTGDEAKEKAQEYVKEVATVDTDILFVREEPNTDCKVLDYVARGEELAVVDTIEDGAWYLVEIDDEEHYVSGEYVKVSFKLPKAMSISELKYGQGVSDVRVDLVQYALQFVGNRYVWGGTSLTNGVDCSGFTMQVYAKYGVYLPHSSGAQPNYGRRISAGDAQPGDLFFYGSGGSISHVAIYIGGGQVVHASNHRDGIKISNAYYRTPICVASYL